MLLFNSGAPSNRKEVVIDSIMEEGDVVDKEAAPTRMHASRKLIVLRLDEEQHVAAQEHAEHHDGVNKLEQLLNTRYKFTSPGGCRSVCMRTCDACPTCAQTKQASFWMHHLDHDCLVHRRCRKRWLQNRYNAAQ